MLQINPPFKGLFTWIGGPRSSGVGFFCFHALGNTKQKKLTPIDRGPPLHVNRVLEWNKLPREIVLFSSLAALKNAIDNISDLLSFDAFVTVIAIAF